MRNLSPTAASVGFALLVAALAPCSVASASAGDGATGDSSTTTTTTPTNTTAPTSTTAPPTSAPTTPPPSTTTTSTTVPTSGAATTESTTTSSTSTTVAPAPAPRYVIVRGDRIQHILATIRFLESNNDYEAPLNKGNASGAYQYITSSWAGYAGFQDAYLAPPWIQDERAAADVEAILRRWNNDVSMVPIMWYYPAAANDPSLLDVVPKPYAGNVLTVREYQLKWLDTFAFISKSPPPLPLYPLPGLELLSGIPPVVPDDPAGELQLAFPVLGEAAVAPPPACDEGETCDGPRDAVIFGRKLQPVLAAADGVVTAVQPGDPATGDVSITITDTRGFSYHYSGLNDDTPGTDDGLAPPELRLTALASFGHTVRAGQVIGFVGDSDPVPVDPTAVRGDPVWPHVRFSITDITGQPVDAERPIVYALFRQRCTVGIGPWAVPARAELLAEPVERVVVPAGAVSDSDDVPAGEWVIGRFGEVTASGSAALVYPTEGCLWAPDEAFGPGAGGNATVPDGFYDEITLPTGVWIAATVGTGSRLVAPRLRG